LLDAKDDAVGKQTRIFILLVIGALILILAPASLQARQAETVAPPPASGTERLLALNIYNEARGEGRKGMIAVGWVVLNRLADPAFPRTIDAIILQGQGGKCQWAWVCDDPGRPRDQRSWRLALELAAMMMTSPPPDPTGGALWFKPQSAGDPHWSTAIVRTARIGNHVFYGRQLAFAPPEAKPTDIVLLAGR
jgi:spore germination cell wall hydrolase CwlJ-like protein